MITCSRQAFPDSAPGRRPRGPYPVDLADPDDTLAAVEEIKRRLPDGELHALVNNAGISPKGEDGGRLGTINTARETGCRYSR